MKSEADINLRFDKILVSLWDQQEKFRQAAMDDLADFKRQFKDPGWHVGVKSLQAAAHPYPFEKPNPADVSEALVAVAYSTPHPEYISVVVKLFDKFSDDAKWQVQIILAELESREAAEAYMAIVRTNAPTGKLRSLITWPLEKNSRHSDVFFPELMKYADDPKISFQIHLLCLAYCEAKLLSPVQIGSFTDQILKSYSDLAVKLRPAQKDDGVAWMWEDAYQESRNEAALLLDLFGYLPVERVEKPLREALTYKDPRPKFFAFTSLLRLGKAVEQKDVDDIARQPEMRNALFETLRKFNKSSLYPHRFRTQAAFAESNMVSWLIYPTELSRAPDDIELMKVVTIDTQLTDGIYDYYLFRFRTKEPHWAAKDGWLAGLSGPYLRKNEPTTESLGDTFSSFTKWDDKTPEEHVGDTRELMQRWRKYHASRKD